MPPPGGCARGGGQWAGTHGPPRSVPARRVEEDNGTSQGPACDFMSKKIYGSQSTAIASNLSERIYNKQRQIACVLTCGWCRDRGGDVPDHNVISDHPPAAVCHHHCGTAAPETPLPPMTPWPAVSMCDTQCCAGVVCECRPAQDGFTFILHFHQAPHLRLSITLEPRQLGLRQRQR